MADGELGSVPDALIDSDGVFKYVLIHVEPAGPGPGKDIVRGHAWAEYHADLFEQAAQELEKRGFRCRCLGGGRISHQSGAKKIHVYGYSVVRTGILSRPVRAAQGFGGHPEAIQRSPRPALLPLSRRLSDVPALGGERLPILASLQVAGEALALPWPRTAEHPEVLPSLRAGFAFWLLAAPALPQRQLFPPLPISSRDLMTTGRL
uniref:14 kDa phosphohistidine phosphatase n=1 Tax=Naja naja TaxID=35670 RepID=A0A8C6XI48_NAJNA